jgi:hypothetical protein
MCPTELRKGYTKLHMKVPGMCPQKQKLQETFKKISNIFFLDVY